MSKYFLGLDLSLTNSGVCLIDDLGEIALIDSIYSTSPEEKSVRSRILRYRKIAKDIVGKLGIPTFTEIEGIAIEENLPWGVYNIKPLAESSSIIKLSIIEMMPISKPILEINPSDLKKYILEEKNKKGQNTKVHIMEEIKEKFKIEIKDDNQADAFILATMSKDIYMYNSFDKEVQKTIKDSTIAGSIIDKIWNKEKFQFKNEGK
jgi:hypothetical protein